MVAPEPVPTVSTNDPSSLTTEALLREIGHLRELVMGRIDSLEKGQERAAQALANAVDRTEVRVNEKLTALKEGFEVNLAAIADQIERTTEKLGQVDKDRTLYVTRNDLDTLSKVFASNVAPLEKAGYVAAGKAVALQPYIAAAFSIVIALIVFAVTRAIS